MDFKYDLQVNHVQLQIHSSPCYLQDHHSINQLALAWLRRTRPSSIGSWFFWLSHWSLLDVWISSIYTAKLRIADELERKKTL